MATQIGANYQWVDCNEGNAPIDGETEQTFTPEESGSYAVQISVDGCDTEQSDCEEMIVQSIDNQDLTLTIYPNPTTNFLIIESSQPGLIVRVFSSDGKQVFITPSWGILGSLEIDTSSWEAGTYVVQAKDKTYTVVKN